MASDEKKIYHFDEVSKHKLTKDCWLVISGKVYDVTPFMDDHPGGDEVLLAATDWCDLAVAPSNWSTKDMEFLNNKLNRYLPTMMAPEDGFMRVREDQSEGAKMKPHPSSRKDATDDFEDVGHSTSAREMMDKYYIGVIDAASVPTKRAYVPPQQAAYNPDKTSDFVIKILQFLVPVLILGLAFAARHFTKAE